MQAGLLIDAELSVLRPLCRTWPLAFRSHGLRLRGFENAGLDIRFWLLSLELSDLVTQLLVGLLELADAIQKFTNHPQQRLDQRRPFLGPNLGQLHLHASQCTKPTRDQLRQFSALLRSYVAKSEGLEMAALALRWGTRQSGEESGGGGIPPAMER